MCVLSLSTTFFSFIRKVKKNNKKTKQKQNKQTNHNTDQQAPDQSTKYKSVSLKSNHKNLIIIYAAWFYRYSLHW